MVSEPPSDYRRWRYACTDVNVSAGEDVRWLPRTKAAGLLLVGADCWVSGHRVVRWNFQRGDGTIAAWATQLDARLPGQPGFQGGVRERGGYTGGIGP